MKKYIDAQLQVVRMNNSDIVTLSIQQENYDGSSTILGADRFRDWEEY
jgi:hypothetical protein